MGVTTSSNSAITYEPIATYTATGSVSSYTFNSISGAYTDLVLIMSPISSAAGNNIWIQFNSDTAANYSDTWLNGTGSAANSGRHTSASNIVLTPNTIGSNTAQQTYITSILNYSNSTTYKTTLTRTNDASTGTAAIVGLWRSTAAITSLTVGETTSTFQSGSIFTLYGIKAA